MNIKHICKNLIFIILSISSSFLTGFFLVLLIADGNEPVLSCAFCVVLFGLMTWGLIHFVTVENRLWFLCFLAPYLLNVVVALLISEKNSFAAFVVLSILTVAFLSIMCQNNGSEEIQKIQNFLQLKKEKATESFESNNDDKNNAEDKTDFELEIVNLNSKYCPNCGSEIIPGTICATCAKNTTFYLKSSRKKNMIVRLTSPKLHELNKIIKETPIVNTKSDYLKYECRSRKHFDKISREKALISLIYDNEDYFRKIALLVYPSENNYRLYKRKLKELKKKKYLIPADTGISNFTYRVIENHIFNKLTSKRKFKRYNLKILKSYTSPKKQVNLRTTYIFSCEDVARTYNYCQSEKARKEFMREFAKYQRSLLSSELRYDILKRDNFRCVICGRSQADGVKLHVDHIIPVSKGGKTEWNNLRTLCEDCNLGKSNKYDPYGIN